MRMRSSSSLAQPLSLQTNTGPEDIQKRWRIRVAAISVLSGYRSPGLGFLGLNKFFDTKSVILSHLGRKLKIGIKASVVVPKRFFCIRQRCPTIVLYVLYASTFVLPVSASFDDCLDAIRSGRWGSTGAKDVNGNPVANMSDVASIPYEFCVRACGSSYRQFWWSLFFQQFSTWLLPWLALSSQLPYGGRFDRDNLLSIVLTVGSPTLAGYSLALTVLNQHWVARRFDGLNYPNSQYAAHILTYLQQMPIKIITEDCLLASLVVLPENDQWWKYMAERLNYTIPWSLVATFNIAWVVVPYLLTIISSFTDFIDSTDRSHFSAGQSVGSAWFWMLALVTGWLWFSPKSDFNRIRRLIDCVNEQAHVATPIGIRNTGDKSTARAISLRERYQGSLLSPEERSPPIFNYARFLSWVQAVEDVHSAYRAASRKAGAHQAVNPDVDWIDGRNAEVDAAYRMGTMEQIEAYCRTPDYVRRSRWGPNVWSRIMVASLLGLALQWGTAGAAIVVVWFAPTRGMGCRSAGYILYAVLSTIVWIMLLASSLLAHYTKSAARINRSTLLICCSRFASIGLRHVGHFLAVGNALWIMIFSLLQFSGFMDNCYCGSSVLGLGRNAAYYVLQPSHSDVSVMIAAWVAGAISAAAFALLFFVFVRLSVDALPDTKTT